jgi:hypothetical protein
MQSKRLITDKANTILSTIQLIVREEHVIVTTPHGCKPGASGMTRLCRPTAIVRFRHTSELSLKKQLVSRMAQPTLGRSCFYLAERFTPEPANTIQLEVGKELHTCSLHTLEKRK